MTFREIFRSTHKYCSQYHVVKRSITPWDSSENAATLNDRVTTTTLRTFDTLLEAEEYLNSLAKDPSCPNIAFNRTVVFTAQTSKNDHTSCRLTPQGVITKIGQNPLNREEANAKGKRFCKGKSRAVYLSNTAI